MEHEPKGSKWKLRARVGDQRSMVRGSRGGGTAWLLMAAAGGPGRGGDGRRLGPGPGDRPRARRRGGAGARVRHRRRGWRRDDVGDRRVRCTPTSAARPRSRRWWPRAVERHGRLDVMVNNAAIQIEEELAETTEEQLDRILGRNLKGVFFGCKHAVRVMRPAGGGTIVNIASILALVGDGILAAYCAAKGGVLGITRATAVQYGATASAATPSAPATSTRRWCRPISTRPTIPAALRAEVSAEYPLGTDRTAARDRPRGRLPGLRRRLVHERPAARRRRRPAGHVLLMSCRIDDALAATTDCAASGSRTSSWRSTCCPSWAARSSA